MSRVGLLEPSELVDIAHWLELLGHVVVTLPGIDAIGADSRGIECVVVSAASLRARPEAQARCDAAGIRLIAIVRDQFTDHGLLPSGVVTVRESELADALPAAVAHGVVPTPGAQASAAPLVAVWGAPGAPGASTLAANLAVELALGPQRGGARGRRNERRRVVLIDLDCWAPALVAMFGATPDVPGVVAAARLAEMGELTPAEIARLCVDTPYGVRLLGGLSATGRWAELSAARIGRVLDAVRRNADMVVVDLGSHAPRDEIALLDPLAPRRTSAAEAAASAATLLIGCGAGNPISLARLVRAWPAWAEVTTARRELVVSHVRRGALGLDSAAQINRACRDFIGVHPMALLPRDHQAADATMRAGQPLAVAAAKSSLRHAIRELAAELAGELLGGSAVAGEPTSHAIR
ncbi:MAG TPA: hypothetical protein VK139_00660 [Microbacteriaceae bacterium]|nr:hypothetical protein [Microbacteriaceae bacterium]